MKKPVYAVAAAIFAIGIFGSVGPVMATPDESQRLRGLEGRVFEVEVQNLTTGEPPFQNCYFFREDGVWIDPPFPAEGTFVQHSNGASTTYTSEAFFEIPGIISLVLVQDGVVTPALGGGVLQFEATSWVTGFLLTPEGPLDIEWEFLSVGFQNDDCVPPPP